MRDAAWKLRNRKKDRRPLDTVTTQSQGVHYTTNNSIQTVRVPSYVGTLASGYQMPEEDKVIYNYLEGAAKRLTRKYGDDIKFTPVNYHPQGWRTAMRAQFSAQKRDEFIELICKAYAASDNPEHLAMLGILLQHEISFENLPDQYKPTTLVPKKVEIHHIIPTSLGGGNKPENMCALNAKPHRREHNAQSRQMRDLFGIVDYSQYFPPALVAGSTLDGMTIYSPEQVATKQSNFARAYASLIEDNDWQNLITTRNLLARGEK